MTWPAITVRPIARHVNDTHLQSSLLQLNGSL
jgi:hypothetical protein